MGKKITQENDSASLLCSGGFGGTSPTTMRQIQFPTYIETYIAGFEREREREREREENHVSTVKLTRGSTSISCCSSLCVLDISAASTT